MKTIHYLWLCSSVCVACGNDVEESSVSPPPSDVSPEQETLSIPLETDASPVANPGLSGTIDDFTRLSSEWEPQFNPASDSYVEPADFMVSAAMTPLMGVAIMRGLSNFSDMALQSKRSELRSQIQAIRIAQIEYHLIHGRYVAVDDYEPDSQPGSNLRDLPKESGFSSLGWRPEGGLRGSYKVVVESPSDFRVMGISDLDEDGERAVFTATKSINVSLNTDSDIY